MSDELSAVLRIDGTVYGASGGSPFPSAVHAEQVVTENPAVFAGRIASIVEIEPHGLPQAMFDETHDSAGTTGMQGTYDRMVAEAHPAPAGSPGGTLRDPNKRSLLAVLIDRSTNAVYGTSGGADQPVFGELAKARETAAVNVADHLTEVEIRPFDELLG